MRQGGVKAGLGGFACSSGAGRNSRRNSSSSSSGSWELWQHATFKQAVVQLLERPLECSNQTGVGRLQTNSIWSAVSRADHNQAGGLITTIAACVSVGRQALLAYAAVLLDHSALLLPQNTHESHHLGLRGMLLLVRSTQLSPPPLVQLQFCSRSAAGVASGCSSCVGCNNNTTAMDGCLAVL